MEQPEKKPMPSLPLDELVAWFNEHSSANDADRDTLLDILRRNPEFAGRPEIAAKMAKTAGRAALLEDFKGLLMWLSQEAQGNLDDVTHFLQAGEPLDDTTET